MIAVPTATATSFCQICGLKEHDGYRIKISFVSTVSQNSNAKKTLCLPVHTPLPQLRLDLFRRFELNGVDTLRPRPCDVVRDVVGKEALLGKASGLFNCPSVNLRQRFHRADLIRQHERVEVAQQRIVFANHFEMDRVGIRKQYEPVVSRDAGEHRLRDQRVRQKDRAPDLAEIFVARIQIQMPG